MTDKQPNLDSLFQAALELESLAERNAFLDESCGREGELREQLNGLLRSHEQAGSFLENPPGELEATLMPHSNGDDLAASLGGLTSAFGDEAAVILGNANHSILKALGQTVDVPHVMLREAADEGPGPVQRPGSPQIPDRDADSRYQLQGEIARGGMGAIIKGRDTDLGRDLAVKVLLDGHKDKPEVIQRFIEEAQIGGQLQHPGIAPVYELGQFADNRPFFSMKLVKGKTLSAMLDERADPADDLAKFLGIFEQVCQTMAYAHSRGVIHRDLKPANVMVGAFGEVQVMDWGLAKVLANGGVADEKKARTRHKDVSIIETMRSVGSDTPGTFGSAGSTKMGSVMGTPAYMPPEQALGEIDRLDERADVFGLGAILCEMLTGKPPYVGEDGTQVFRQASRGRLDDCFARLDECQVEPELTDLVKTTLAIEPEQRPRNASVVAEGVTKYLAGVQERLKQAELAGAAANARAEHATRRRRLVIAIAGLMLLMAIGAGFCAVHFRQQRETQAKLAREKSKLANENFALAEQNEKKRLAAERDRETIRDQKNQAVAMTETLQQKQYVADMHLVRQAYDDGVIGRVRDLLAKHIPAVGETDRRGFEWYYWWRASHLELSSVDQGGTPFMALLVSPNQKLIAVHSWPERLEIRDAASLKIIAYEKIGINFGFRMAFSADSEVVATTGAGQTDVRLWNTNEATLRSTEDVIAVSSIERPHQISALAFSTTESRLAIAESGGPITFWNPQTGNEIEGSLDCRLPITAMAFSPDGSQLAAIHSSREQDGSILVFDLAEGRLIKTLQGRQRSITCIAWSRSASRNVLATGSSEGVCLWNGETFDDLNTMATIGPVSALTFNPDGSRLAADMVNRHAVQIWETDTSDVVTIIRGHDRPVVGSGFLNQGAAYVSCGSEGVLSKWDLGQAKPFEIIASADEAGSKERVRWLFGRDTPVRRSDFVLLQGMKGFTEMPTGDLTALSDNGRYLAVLGDTADQAARLKIWQRTEFDPRLVYENHEIPSVALPAVGIAVAGDGSKVAWVREGEVFIHSVKSGLTTSQQLHNFMRLVSLSTDGNMMAMSDGHRTRTWIVDISNGAIPENQIVPHDDKSKKMDHAYCFQLPTGFAQQCVFSPDGSHLAIATTHSDIFMLNVRTRNVVWGIRETVREHLRETYTHTHVGWGIDPELVDGGKGHAGAVASLAFSSDGSLIASVGEDKTVRVWDFKTGSLRSTLVGHKSSVVGVVFSRESEERQTITSMDFDGDIFVWPAATETEVERDPQFWEARAKRYRALGDTTNADADLVRFHELRPDREVRESFDTFNELYKAAKWAEAAHIGRRLLHASQVDNPSDNEKGFLLRLAPVLVLAGDEAGYRDFCSRLSGRFAGTDEYQIAEHVCKACLLLPDAIDLEKIPHVVLATALDEGTTRPGLLPWLWTSRSLVAYRLGDTESAIAYAEKSEQFDPHQLMKMLNASILALAHHRLGQLENSYTSLYRGRRIHGGFIDPDTGFPNAHDALITGLLLDEATALLSDAQSSSASAHEDWLRSVTSNPNLSDAERFDILRDFEQWKAAADVGWRIVEQAPSRTESWLKLAPILVLAGDDEAYRDFCSRMVKQFGATNDVGSAERMCKACLLMPEAVKLNDLPHAVLAKAFDEGTASDTFLPWGWLARALVDYRRGDAESAVACVNKAEELNASKGAAHALSLAIAALACGHLGNAEKSRRDAEEASEILDRLLMNFNPANHHDLLMAKILLRELQAQRDSRIVR